MIDIWGVKSCVLSNSYGTILTSVCKFQSNHVHLDLDSITLEIGEMTLELTELQNPQSNHNEIFYSV
jgi:hypothetical protein